MSWYHIAFGRRHSFLGRSLYFKYLHLLLIYGWESACLFAIKEAGLLGFADTSGRLPGLEFRRSYHSMISISGEAVPGYLNSPQEAIGSVLFLIVLEVTKAVQCLLVSS